MAYLKNNNNNKKTQKTNPETIRFIEKKNQYELFILCYPLSLIKL